MHSNSIDISTLNTHVKSVSSAHDKILFAERLPSCNLMTPHGDSSRSNDTFSVWMWSFEFVFRHFFLLSSRGADIRSNDYRPRQSNLEFLKFFQSPFCSIFLDIVHIKLIGWYCAPSSDLGVTLAMSVKIAHKTPNLKNSFLCTHYGHPPMLGEWI